MMEDDVTFEDEEREPKGMKDDFGEVENVGSCKDGR